MRCVCPERSPGTTSSCESRSPAGGDITQGGSRKVARGGFGGQASRARCHCPAARPLPGLYLSRSGWRRVSIRQASPSASQRVSGARVWPAGARRCLQAGGPGAEPGLPGPGRRHRLKGPLVRPLGLPAAARGSVLLPHKRLICYIFSDAVNGRTKTFSLSYFRSIMFVGEPDPLQRGARELGGEASQAC